MHFRKSYKNLSKRTHGFLQNLLRQNCLICNVDQQQRNYKNSSETIIASVCEPCSNQFLHNIHCCKVCSIPLLLQDNEISEELCGACQQNPPPWEKAIATFVYAYPLDRLVIGLKYHGRLDYADTLAALMSQDLQYAYANNENIHKNGLPQALLPVPLHPIREFQRGYNQAHLLANALSRHLSVPVLPGLVHRVRHTPRQSLLSQEQRQKNLQKAFQVNHKIEIPEFVALIDDVMTTGATAEAVSKALISAGVKRVDVWCCARAE